MFDDTNTEQKEGNDDIYGVFLYQLVANLWIKAKVWIDNEQPFTLLKIPVFLLLSCDLIKHLLKEPLS